MKLRTTLLAATAMMLAAAAHAEDLTIATVNNGDMIRMQKLQSQKMSQVRKFLQMIMMILPKQRQRYSKGVKKCCMW